MSLRILARSKAGDVVGTVSPTSVKAIPRYNAVGTWSITAALTDKSAVLLEKGSAVVIRDAYGTLTSGRTTDFDIDRNGDETTITVSGLSDELHLLDRRCYPTPANPATNQPDARDIVSGVASTVLRHYVDVNAGPGARPERQSGLVLEDPDPLIGKVIVGSPRFHQLWDLVQFLANFAGLGFRVSRGITGPPTFYVFQPQDLTADIRFSFGLHNLSSLKWSLTAPKATTVISGGQGELTSRLFAEATDAAAAADWGRRIEDFYDVRNEDDPVKLQDDTDAQLAEKGETGQVSFVPSPTSRFQPRRDFDLGDSITVEIVPGVRVAAVVRELEVDQDANGVVTYIPRAGDTGATATPADRVKLSDALRRLRSMETR